MFNFSLKSKTVIPEPETFEELMVRLDSLIGKNLAELAKLMDVPLPPSSTRGKGFAGALIELCLGASAGNLPQPDFPKLALELKTMPLDCRLCPEESTFVTHAPLLGMRNVRFEDTVLYKKLSRIVFVFIESAKEVALPERRVLGYTFWSPDDRVKEILKNDFEELMELVNTGHIEDITARIGTIIQMRPKSASGLDLTECVGPDGSLIKTRPRGFYLRRSFTKQIVESFLHGQ